MKENKEEIMNTYEMKEACIKCLGEKYLLEEILKWLSTDEQKEILSDIMITNDLDMLYDM